MLQQKDLGDYAGIIKCLYPMQIRISICEAVEGLKAETGSTEADANVEDVFQEEEQRSLEEQLAKDPVMQEHAGRAVCLNYLRRTDLFDGCTTRADFQDKLKDINDMASATKLIAASVKKCIKEVQSMIKAETDQS